MQLIFQQGNRNCKHNVIYGVKMTFCGKALYYNSENLCTFDFRKKDVIRENTIQ